MPKGMNVQNEAADVLTEWKAVYAELFPHRPADAMRVDDADLALAVLVRRLVLTPGEVRERITSRLKPYTGDSA